MVIECCVGEHSSNAPSFAQTLMVCFAEFIHLIASEANDVCEEESKKTIAPEHIISALKVCRTSVPFSYLTLIPSFSVLVSIPSPLK